ncbi:MAG: hypothetical protein LBL00_07480 [Endomicrobium sp.]|jgi:predicted Fe-Mo cluster-binding NifX family protein|nr:hypothetical protein [Endomicrobium sp.]
MKKIRIALASSDGEFIDTHFGKCEAFRIIDMDKHTKKYEYIEIRKSDRMCGQNGHTAEGLENIIKLLCDCSYVIVARIGIWIKADLEKREIIPIEFFGTVKEALEKTHFCSSRMRQI